MRLAFRTRNTMIAVTPKPSVPGVVDAAQFPMLARSEAFAEDLTDLVSPVEVSGPSAFSGRRNSPVAAAPGLSIHRLLLNS